MTGVQIVKSAMKSKGWDERKLSLESGVHITLIRRYFGKYSDKPVRIGPLNARRLALALGIDVEGVLYGAKVA